jgi:dihydrofolate reductase
VAHALLDAFALAESRDEDELFVAGGASVYAQALPFSDRVYLTVVHTRMIGDVFFPALPMDHWVATRSETHPAGEKDSFPTTFSLLERAQ